MSFTGSAKKSEEKFSRSNIGLSKKEAEVKLQKHGRNTITEKKKISVLKILFAQFSDFMVLILLVSTLISAFMGEVTEAITIMAIVALNAVLGFFQEFRTEKTMEALKGLIAPTAKVVREGCIINIPAELVVPGDLIILESGDRIPADAYLIDVKGLMVDESLLTGESQPVEKSLNEKGKNYIFMGTIVTNGRGRALVTNTGMETEMGKIADLIQNIEEDQTPLQKRLESLGKFIVYGCLVICAVVSITGVIRGEALFTMLIAGISLAVAAVPEGLPAIVTIALALGVQRMMKRKALIRRLPAVETLGCASVICSDKTGTLTENRMTVRKLYTDDKIVDIKGTGYNIEGKYLLGTKEMEPLKNKSIKLALEIGCLCNNAKIVRSESGKDAERKGLAGIFAKKSLTSIDGEPTEGALLVAAAKAGITSEALEKNYFRIDELPFDSERKCMSVICDNHRGETFVFTKGAPDVIIDKCSRIFTANGTVKMSQEIRDKIIKVNDSLAGEALRVIGVAYKRLEFRTFNLEMVERDLVFAGLFGMIDPPRKEAVDAVNKCKMAGIKPVMITGDHKMTALSIAKELNIYEKEDKILTGDELENIDDAALLKIAESVSVYARVSPKHKLRIVKVLKKLGHIVAMTGDGVNDAPAIKEADIGVSMGMTGTDVTKEASSMILMDDNFATIVAAVEEGRVIYNNIRKFIRYMLACNLGEVLTMFLGMILGLPLPLLPIQILWVNLVTDGLPAIALGFDPPEKDIMMRRPRSAKESIFSNGLLGLILFRGILIGFCTLSVFAIISNITANLELARTGAFVTLVITQLIHVFECKSERKNIFEIPLLNNTALIISVICSLFMILGVIYIPSMQSVFKTVPLSIDEWIVIGGFSALGPVLASFFKRRK